MSVSRFEIDRFLLLLRGPWKVDHTPNGIFVHNTPRFKFGGICSFDYAFYYGTSLQIDGRNAAVSMGYLSGCFLYFLRTKTHDVICDDPALLLPLMDIDMDEVIKDVFLEAYTRLASFGALQALAKKTIFFKYLVASERGQRKCFDFSQDVVFCRVQEPLSPPRQFVQPLRSSDELTENVARSLCQLESEAGSVVCEVSGGIDSSIVYAALTRKSGLRVLTVSKQNKFPEFRNEVRCKNDLLNEFNTKNFSVPQSLVGDITSLNPIGWYPEPNPMILADRYYSFCVSLCRGESVQLFATGYGGDWLFSNHKELDFEVDKERISFDLSLIRSQWKPRVRSMLENCLSEASAQTRHVDGWPPIGFSENPGINARFWQDGIIQISPLSSLSLASGLSDIKERKLWNDFPDYSKSIARTLFQGVLPASIIFRRCKVDHVGLERRAVLEYYNAINELVHNTRQRVWEEIFDLVKIQRTLDCYKDGTIFQHREFMAFLSTLVWVRSVFWSRKERAAELV